MTRPSSELKGEQSPCPRGFDQTQADMVRVKRGGKEFPRAFVVSKNKSLTPSELDTYIRERFARHKWLTGGVFFIDAIPRNLSGKIIRRALPSLVERLNQTKL